MRKGSLIPTIANILLIISLLLLVPLLALQLLKALPEKQEKQPESTEQEEFYVATATVQPRLIVDSISFPGAVRPITEVKLASEVGGKVDWIGTEEGKRISTGAKVLRINAADKKAALALAIAELRLAEKEKERADRLFKQNTISEAELDQRKAAYEAAVARRELAQAELDKTTITSTISGFVNRVPIEVGEYVNPGDLVAEILVLDQVEVEVDVPEKDIGAIDRDTEVWVFFEYLAGDPTNDLNATTVHGTPIGRLGSLRLRGTITYIARAADPVARTFQVKVMLPNPKGIIRAGMITRAVFIKSRFPDAIVVPLFTVLPGPEGEHVLFVEKQGQARRRQVQLGVTEGRWVQIRKGLAAGEQLIVEGQALLDDGDPVTVVRSNGRRTRQQ